MLKEDGKKEDDMVIEKIEKRMRVTYLIAITLLALLCGCGQKEPVKQEVSIFYHEEDGAEESVAYTFEASEPEGTESGKTDPKSGKIVLSFVASAMKGCDSNFANVVNEFNQENDKYFVELTTYHFGDELGDAHTRIAAEIAAGGGPDILYEDVFHVNQGILDKGTLVDLTPYLEESGITQENYFPGYASIVSDGKIYGVTPDCSLRMYVVDAEVLGGHEVPDFETLLDKLLAYPEKAGFKWKYATPLHLMKSLLSGSETLWGAIDWEQGVCDFHAPVFSKLLEVSKRYGEDNLAGYEPVVTEERLDFNTIGEGKLDDPDRVCVGTYFDDGCYPLYFGGYDALMINANTEHLEGAYAFLSYVMIKGQKYSYCPLRRKTWENQYQYHKELGDSGKTFPRIELTDERKQLALEFFETGRYYPRRAEEILDIVYEEAEAYFQGSKSKEAVLDLIQNRVQLYLDEG